MSTGDFISTPKYVTVLCSELYLKTFITNKYFLGYTSTWWCIELAFGTVLRVLLTRFGVPYVEPGIETLLAE